MAAIWKGLGFGEQSFTGSVLCWFGHFASGLFISIQQLHQCSAGCLASLSKCHKFLLPSPFLKCDCGCPWADWDSVVLIGIHTCKTAGLHQILTYEWSKPSLSLSSLEMELPISENHKIPPYIQSLPSRTPTTALSLGVGMSTRGHCFVRGFLVFFSNTNLDAWRPWFTHSSKFSMDATDTK